MARTYFHAHDKVWWALEYQPDILSCLFSQLPLSSASAQRSSRRRWPLSAWSPGARPSSAPTPWTKPPTSGTPCPRPCTDASSAGSSTASTPCCSPTWISGACVLVIKICVDVFCKSLLFNNPERSRRVFAKHWWPLWKSVEVDANMQRRISMGRHRTSKRRAKTVLIKKIIQSCVPRKNNVQMIKKTSERLQRGFSLIQKNSFINMSISCQGVVSEMYKCQSIPVIFAVSLLPLTTLEHRLKVTSTYGG